MNKTINETIKRQNLVEQMDRFMYDKQYGEALSIISKIEVEGFYTSDKKYTLQLHI